MIRCQRRQNSNSQQARKKIKLYFLFAKVSRNSWVLFLMVSEWRQWNCFMLSNNFFGLVFFKFSDPLWRKWKKKHSGIPFSYLRKRRQSLLFDFPNNFIFMKLEAFFNIEFWNSNSNQNQIGWSGRVQWQIIFHLLSLCIQGDSALMLVIWK